ncbi:NADH-quinone oxidoreductase subunit L [Candidatus Solirubrobacter pratensis]|uniref:NADH-quinone oxidoreductase subunit L n=1 Tax=Candidatus Solirubrobacter pratensis TaxID=1298857 RepID=UPI00041CEC6B|nr:NADH-quinone oxidoreductase subunit L [Candidatus Solirubrobacter pratensis]
MTVTTYGWLVLAFPLAGSLLIGLTFKALPQRLHGVIGVLAILLAFLSAVAMFFKLQDLGEEHRQVVSVGWDYAKTVGVDAQLSILVDPLSTLMCLVVAGVSTLIHLYSFAYMGGDRGYSRFFAYLNFFVFSMLLLVLAANFFLLIVGWAFVGAASYFLISFWYRRTTATRAGIKAFVINVLGDVGLVLGTYFIFRGTHTLDFLTTFHEVDRAFTVNEPSLVAGCILLLVGAFAKSAQVPLHTWLPDAMEGPTPVSALIHAATMVTAGVYLIARLHPLFERAPDAAAVGAIIGCITLLVAATIGLVVTDLKRVIAYSTMSQIGYMIMGVSSAAYAAGMFHLMTHAFFKALLFMAAGSVISAMGGIQDLDRMSGFRKAMPFTFACMVIGGLALSGIPPFSGFFSKDEIISLEFDRGGWHTILGVAGYLGAFMTAIYTFRMIFRAFFGEPSPEAQELEHGHLYHAPEPTNPATGEVEDTDVGFPGPEHHIAEREGSMKVAMGSLAVLAIIGGFLQIPGVTNSLHTFLEPTFADSRFYADLEPSAGTQWVGLIVGAAIGLAGIAIAWRLWGDGRRPELATRFGALHRFLVNKWYFDEVIDFLVVRPVAWFGRFAQGAIERGIVDGVLVGGASGTIRALSAAVRGVQTGYLRYYAALLLVGLTALGAYFLVSA